MHTVLVMQNIKIIGRLACWLPFCYCTVKSTECFNNRSKIKIMISLMVSPIENVLR